MKTPLKTIGHLGLLSLLMAGSVRAQDWSFGPKVYLGLSKQATAGDQVRIGTTTLSSVNYGDAIGSSAGIFARYDRLRWYVQGEGMYGKYSLTNAQVNNLSGGFPLYPSVKRTDVRLIGGIKPLPWLRVNAGLTSVYNQAEQTNYGSTIGSLQEAILRSPS